MLGSNTATTFTQHCVNVVATLFLSDGDKLFLMLNHFGENGGGNVRTDTLDGACIRCVIQKDQFCRDV